MSELLERLEKTAQDAYPEEGRINRGFLAETFLGGGPTAYFAKKNNSMGVNEDDSHAAANAKHLAGLGAIGGALYGAGTGALTKGVPGAIAGGVAGAGAGALYSAGIGGGIGFLHDQYDKGLRNRQVRENIDEEQLASDELLQRLEKTAAPLAGVGNKAKNLVSTAYGKKTRKAEKMVERDSKRFNKHQEKAYDPEANPSDAAKLKSQTVDRAKRTQEGKDYAARLRAETTKARKQIGTGAGLVGAGAGAGSLAGYHYGNKEKTANEELMERLEKTAAPLVGAVKGFGRNLLGTNKRHAQGALNAAKESGSTKAITKAENSLDRATKNTNKARIQTGVGAGAVGAGVGAGALANNALNKEKEEKTASEDFMSDLYKEAASQILDMQLPEVKKDIDPIDKIKFNR